MPGSQWVFDVDGCLIDSHTGSSLRPGAVNLLTTLRTAGCRIVVWSAGGAEYARNRVIEQGVDDLVDACYGKDSRDPSGFYRVDHLGDGCTSMVFVDDRPEDLSPAHRVIAVAPYLGHNPHDRALLRIAHQLHVR
jgi:long-chain acyl-CoA synthetase